MNPCHKCGTLISVEARFCNVCGFIQNPSVPPPTVPAYIQQNTPQVTFTGDKTLLDPSQLASPTRNPRIMPPMGFPSPAWPGSSSLRSTPGTSKTSLPAQTSVGQDYKTPAPPPHQFTLLSPQPHQYPGPSYTAPEAHNQNKEQLSGLPTHQHQPPPSKQVSSDRAQGWSPEQLAHNSMAPIPPMAPPGQRSSTYNLYPLPTNHLSTQSMNGQNGSANASTMNVLNPESFVTTSKAAEHWRKSWRARQYAEAGPVQDVSRGQASVPMPLMSMHQSFARMRAIAGVNKQQKDRSSIAAGSWITIFLMFCLIVGLGAYIISTYLPDSPYGTAQAVPQANTPPPALTIQGTTSQTFKIGQAIHLHGDHFNTNDIITFLLDTITPIKEASGNNNISTQANSQGAFDVTFSIGTDWTTGSHSIEAIDSKNNQNAFVTIQVIPAGDPVTASPDLSVTVDDKPVQLLTFTAVTVQENPNPQPITIRNTSQAPLKWSATASSDNSWLDINDYHTFGQLAIFQTDTLLISVNIAGLKSASYTGQIIFTINDNQQLTLPVQLQISDAAPEMVFSPDPIIAQLTPGNTCQPGVTLTLINLSTLVINWRVLPDDKVKDNIQFVNTINGRPGGPPIENGTLARSGQSSDTQVLTLQCHNVQVGQQYYVTVYANNISWPELVIIR